MKPKSECADLARAAILVLADKTGATSRQDVANLSMLTMSLLLDGVLVALGSSEARKQLDALATQIGEHEREVAGQLLAVAG
jgi:ribosomal silencing factor RsfS